MTTHRDRDEDFDEAGGEEHACGGGRRRHRRHHRGRKERVLHTRVSEPLAEDIRRMADDLRVPVSNLVRNVLEEAFSVVETVTDNVGDLIEDVVDEADRVREEFRRGRRRGARRRHHFEQAEVDEEPGAEAPESEAPARREFPSVLGWQPLILNQRQSCADCETPIERGARAFAGMIESGFSGVYLCRGCMDARR